MIAPPLVEPGLTPSTLYYAHVRTFCGGSLKSAWVTISFTTAAPGCTPVTGLAASSITSTDADISWTGIIGGGVTYEYVIDNISSDPLSGGTATGGTFAHASALTPGTTYYAHVRTDCGGGSYSTWLTIPFTTSGSSCSPVTGLAAGSITSTDADIAWAAVTGAVGYEYIVNTTPGSPITSGTFTTAITTHSPGLLPSTTYYAHVRTDCGGGVYSTWTTIPFTTLAIPCNPVTGLGSSSITSNDADISWTPVTGAIGYEYVINVTPGAPITSGTPTTSTTTHTSGLSPSTTYYAHVRTSCGSGTFSSWTTTSFTTLSSPCSPVTGIIAGSITSTDADITWAAVTGATGYEYVVNTTIADPFTSGTSTTATTFHSSGLSSSTTYYAHVRTNCGGGILSAWSTIPFTTLVAPCSSVTGLGSSSITSTDADISWSPVAGATGYEYVVDNTPTDPSSGGTHTTAVTTHASGLLPSTIYYAHVRTVCSGGMFSSWSATSFTTSAPVCIPVSGLVTAGITPTGATVSWTATAGSLGYEYVVNTTSSAPSVPGTSTTAVSNIIGGLSPATTYYAHVRNNCGGGNLSSWVTTMFSTMAPLPCDNITGLSASPTDVSVTVRWKAVSGSTGYRYLINMKPGDTTSKGLLTFGTSVTQTMLPSGRTYYAHVRNTCADGSFSTWSSIPFSTAPNGISNLHSGFSLSVSPNPTSDKALISIDGTISGFAQIQLLDVYGKMLKTTVVDGSEIIIDMKQFSSGLYFIKYTDSDYSKVIKVEKL